MPDQIKSEIAALKVDYPRIAEIKEEYLFSLVCLQYFLKNGRFDYSIYEESFTDGKDDGGIDLITTTERDGQDVLVLIQSKMNSELANSQDIVDIFTKMHQTIEDFKTETTSRYNRRLKRIYKDQYDQIEAQPPNFGLILFLYADVTDRRRRDIKKRLEGNEDLNKYDMEVYYKKDITEQIKNVNEPKTSVPEGKLKIKKEDGVIAYGENGLLVNAYANSIRDLYDRYLHSGLFEQNFRYFIRNKRIDDNITESLKVKRDQFWFLNNGIIIGCKEFSQDGDNIKLYEFSIINGCQTATLIGEYDGENEDQDFVIPCKIVKPVDEDAFDKFIAEIAEASNSQKPISDRDLKSNRKEQRILQNKLQEGQTKIYLEIKRGETLLTSARRRQLDAWQFLKNDYYGQVILSFHLQQPGLARAGKRYIFSNNSIYNSIFKRRFDKSTIIDTLKIYQFYTDYLNKQLKLEYFTSESQVSVANNGRLHIPSVVGFMVKENRNSLDTRKIRDEKEWETEIQNDCLNCSLFKDDLPDDYVERLEGLFTQIIREIASLYGTREVEEKTVSNFFKSDTKYRNVILQHIVSVFYRDQIKRRYLKSNYLNIFH